MGQVSGMPNARRSNCSRLIRLTGGCFQAAQRERRRPALKAFTLILTAKLLILLVSRAGLEPNLPTDITQVIDSNKRQKRSNRSFRRNPDHGRQEELVNQDCGGKNESAFVDAVHRAGPRERTMHASFFKYTPIDLGGQHEIGSPSGP